MNDTERAELAAAIAKHLPGLKVLPRGESSDGSPWVMWLDDGPLAMVGSASFMVDRRYGPSVWGASGLTRFNVEPNPSPDAILAAVRAHFVTALATARADVAAYERALGEDGTDVKRGRFVLQSAGVTDRHREVGAHLSCAWPSLTDSQLVAIGKVLDRAERGRQ